MDKEQVTVYLQNLPDNEFLALLQEVFRVKLPWPEEVEISRNHYFLGVASQQLEGNIWGRGRWGPWEVGAVAYLDKDHYPEGLGVDGDFCQGGTCRTCGISVHSHVKNGICPICNTPVYMT